MGLWAYVGVGIFLVVTYFLLPWAFNLGILVVILYIIWRLYDFIQRLRTPHGKRIKHGMLKSFLKNKYGKDGTGVYKEMVKEMRKKGYR
jgi:CDP-diglyceride synthetase